VSERKQLKRNYDNSLEGTKSVRKEAAGYHSWSLNKYVVESQFCVLEHETIWKDRKQVHGHLAGKERCEPLSHVERTQTSRWVTHSGKGCQDTESCGTYTDHYGKGPRGNSGSGKPRFSRWLNSSKQNLKPMKLHKQFHNNLFVYICCMWQKHDIVTFPTFFMTNSNIMMLMWPVTNINK